MAWPPLLLLSGNNRSSCSSRCFLCERHLPWRCDLWSFWGGGVLLPPSPNDKGFLLRLFPFSEIGPHFWCCFYWLHIRLTAHVGQIFYASLFMHIAIDGLLLIVSWNYASPSITRDVYCFPRRQLIFSFSGSVAYHYASPSSGEAYRDRRLTTNFELWVENFLCADMFPCENSKTLSVCPSVLTPRKEITLASSISVLH